MAHPLRIRLLEELFVDGPLTATELSERVGESPANCSWHLRQLARYGYVTEAERGTGRRRPWRAVLESRSWGGRHEGDAAAASRTMQDVLVEREYAAHEDYRAREDSEPDAWHDAAFWSQSFFWFTADELRELKKGIAALVMRQAQRTLPRFDDPSSRPADARPVRFVSWAVPARHWSQDDLGDTAAVDDGPAIDRKGPGEPG